MLIYLETNHWGSGRPAIPEGHIYTITWRGVARDLAERG
jgi:hypothetical protein